MQNENAKWQQSHIFHKNHAGIREAYLGFATGV